MIWDFLKVAVPAVCTLLAGYIGIRYGLKHIKVQKELDFIDRQLRQFYSPILGRQKEIRAKSEIRNKISTKAKEAWKEKCKKASGSINKKSPDFEPYEKLIDYDNEQLKNELLPLYREMFHIFREKYYLAEPETLKWYSEFCEFIEIWERSLSKSIPNEVIRKIGHSERKVKPFYKELETRTNLLRYKLSSSNNSDKISYNFNKFKKIFMGTCKENLKKIK